jgi:hypothetical protein
MMVANSPKLVFDQMTAPVPEIMDGSMYVNYAVSSVTNHINSNHFLLFTIPMFQSLLLS